MPTTQMLPIVWDSCNTYSKAFWGSSHEGWCNAATWMFHLYFSQESGNVEAFRKLRKKDGTWNETKVLRLFLTASMNRGGLRMEFLDEWVQNQPINAKEVFEELLLLVPGVFTVTIAGSERHEGHKPYSYVVNAENADAAWAKVRDVFVKEQDDNDVERVRVEAGSPKRDCGYYWNDLR